MAEFSLTFGNEIMRKEWTANTSGLECGKTNSNVIK